MSNLVVRAYDALGHLRDLPASDLEFSKTDRGGSRSATLTIPEWVDFTDQAVNVLSRCRVDDPSTGRTVFESYLDIPGRTVADDGHSWKVGASGISTVLDDRHRPYILIDTDLQAWEKRSSNETSATAQLTSHPDDESIDALVMRFELNHPVTTGSNVHMIYDRIREAGQKMATLYYDRDAGRTDTDYEQRSRWTGGGTDTPAGNTWSTTAATRVTKITTAFDPARTAVYLQAAKVAGGATNIATVNFWAAFYNIIVQAQRKNQAGSYMVGSTDYDNGYILAHDVVIDALQWFTNVVDVPNAIIDDTFTYQIKQFAFPDGIRMSEVMEALALLEPDMWWKVTPSTGGPYASGGFANGMHGFELGRYPATHLDNVRYTATSRDGWDSPGSEANLANAVRIYWTDVRGREKSSVYSVADNPSLSEITPLEQWARVRDAAEVRLGNEVGTQAAVDRVGEAILEQINTVPFAGTLNVARPIFDHQRGCDVMPWEIEPGCLVNVADIAGPPMRLTEMTYRSRDNSASLTLGTPVYSTEELVNKLARRQTTPRMGFQIPTRQT